MSNGNSEVSSRQAAKIAGVGYLVIFVLAIFANFFVVNGLVVPKDAAATAGNIAGAGGLFRAGLVSFAVVFIADVVIAWALYILFRPGHAPRILGIILTVAVPSVLGELGFTIWLLAKGGKETERAPALGGAAQ